MIRIGRFEISFFELWLSLSFVFYIIRFTDHKYDTRYFFRIAFQNWKFEKFIFDLFFFRIIDKADKA